jgi:hypothetical protein
MTGRRFPPPWIVIEKESSFWVQDATGQTVGWFYFQEDTYKAEKLAGAQRRARLSARLHGPPQLQ